MKRKVLPAIPEVFSLRGNDYSGFVVRGGAAGMMHSTWASMGQRLQQAAITVGRDVKKKAA